MPDKTFASFAFGCRVNQAEKEELDKQLLFRGFFYDEKNPSFYIINSCAVTKRGEREARQYINQVRKKYPQTKIVVTGCSATKWIKEKKRIKNADRLIDNVNKEYIAMMISNIKNQISKIHKRKDSKYFSSKRLLIKIQDGCQRYCTYCIVPYLRGKPKSGSIKYLVSSIKYFENDIREVILAAINTEAYGLDTGEKFTDLIGAIINKTSIPRISLGSIHPWSINNDFFKFYKKILPQKRLVNFFHIPLQSGSDKILNLMKRGYTGKEFAKKLKTLYEINPYALIGTDIIVGFLGETDRDFTNTYDFLALSPISKFHIFRFSKREQTAAFYMAKNLKEPFSEVKIKRAKILAKLGKEKYQRFLNTLLGKTFPALFLDKKINGHQEALLDNQIPVFVKTDNNLTGEIRRVKIDSIKIDQLRLK